MLVKLIRTILHFKFKFILSSLFYIIIYSNVPFRQLRLDYSYLDQIKGIKAQLEADYAAKLSRTTQFNQGINAQVVILFSFRLNWFVRTTLTGKSDVLFWWSLLSMRVDF